MNWYSSESPSATWQLDSGLMKLGEHGAAAEFEDGDHMKSKSLMWSYNYRQLMLFKEWSNQMLATCD